MPRESQSLADFSELVEILFLSNHNQHVTLQCVVEIDWSFVAKQG